MFRNRASIFLALLLLLGLLLTNGASVSASHSQPSLVFQDTVLGIGLTSLPGKISIVADQYMSTAYGFTVVDKNHVFQARVEWLWDKTPAQMEQFIDEFMHSFPGIRVKRTQVFVDGRRAVLLSPVPGQVETAAVFVAANGRVYRIFYNAEGNLGKRILHALTFLAPTGDIHSLNLQRAEDALYVSPPYDWQVEPRRPQNEAKVTTRTSEVPPRPDTASGCVDFPTSRFLQTQWAWNANGGSTGLPRGWSKAGPSYFNEGLHKGCNRATRLNDYYALDHPLKEWDIVYPPASGTVLYAGWARGGWAGLGRVVIVDLGGGYWAMAAHLRGINVRVGQHVWLSTVIGWAGRSGHYRDNYWPSVHLHQGLYKDAHLASWAGGIYGGHSAQPIKVHYFGNGGGDYWYIQRYQLMSW